MFNELADRYHALAVGLELFTQHYYSDQFAGGHMSRMGLMRKTLPEQFGTLGSILVNNMHNEDNNDSVNADYPFQTTNFKLDEDDNKSFGDSNYDDPRNNENSNMMINGMTNSLGDIKRLMDTGEMPTQAQYGGLTFMPEIDYNKRQTQPLLLQGKDGQIYFRSEVKNIKMLSPTEYENTIKDPGKRMAMNN